MGSLSKVWLVCWRSVATRRFSNKPTTRLEPDQMYEDGLGRERAQHTDRQSPYPVQALAIGVFIGLATCQFIR